MKKKILSLLLIMAMLLSIVPMAGAAGEVAEPKFTGYNLYLQNDISISFIANRAAIEEGFEKVEFYMGEELVQTRTTLPEADEDGNVAFRCTKLTPAQMGETVTAKLYIGGEVKDEFSTSIKDYCMTILKNESNTEAWKNAELRTMLVDLLNYGAATQTFAEATTPLVNADLGEYAALATTGTLSLTNHSKTFEYSAEADPTPTTVDWVGVGLNLKDSITLRYEIKAPSIENLSVRFWNEDKSMNVYVSNFEKVEGTEDHYYVYLGVLDPTQLSEKISALVYSNAFNSSADWESDKLIYSVESYAYAVANGEYDADLKALTDAMMRYGNAVRCWHNGHVYVNGLCESCDKEKVFVMDGTSITINAADAVLNTNYVNLITNSNVADRKLVKLNNLHSAYQLNGASSYVTRKEHPGDVIVYVTPSVSGVYTVKVSGVYTAADKTFTGVLVEDDTTTDETKYTYRKTPNPCSDPADFATGSITTADFNHPYGAAYAYHWTAGKTYAIRVSSGCAYAALDQFIITHEHVYTNGFCQCGESMFPSNSVIIEAETGVLAEDGTDNVQTETQDLVSLKTNSNAAGSQTVLFEKMASGYNYLRPSSSHYVKDPIPHATYTVESELSGEVYVWLKVYAPNTNLPATDRGDALYCWIGDDNETDTYFWRQPLNKAGKNEYSTSATDFYWVRVYQEFHTHNTANGSQVGENKTYNWTAGETYTIQFRSYAANVQLDQILITTDLTFDPNNP